ncbi:MAG: hypothetical protein AB1646_04540 [Thermodesulfobacteriota bacterium]
MKIPASESTAQRATVTCANGHTTEVWFIRTPEGIVIESFGNPHCTMPNDRNDPAYVDGDCCFRAACEAAWELNLHI